LTSFTGSTSTSLVELAAPPTITGNVSAGAIITDFTAAGTIALGTHTLSVGNGTFGAIYNQNSIGATTISATGGAGSIAFGASEGLLFGDGAALGTTISSQITGTGGLDVGELGTGAITLSATTANTVGPLILDGGVLSVASNDLGTGTVTLVKGTLEATATGGTIGNAVTINGTPTLGGTVALNFSNTVTLAGNSTITDSDTGTGGVTFGALTDGGNGYSLSLAGADATTLSGAIGGTLALNVAGTGTVTVTSSSNSTSGATTVTSGTLQINTPGTIAAALWRAPARSEPSSSPAAALLARAAAPPAR